MEIGEVIFAHVNWRKEFYRFLEGQQELDADVVEADDQCAFGQWLRGSGKVYQDRPEYGEVLEKHAQFHRAAAQAVRLAGTLPPGKAMELVGLRSAFTHASTECVTALCALRHAVEEKEVAGGT